MNTDLSSKNNGNILVVDDTRANLHLLSDMLTRHGYLVRPVSNGSGAISSAQYNPPDLILLDIMMPGMDGYAVCNALKADERTHDVPVIFISALLSTFDKVKAFALGGVDYITKPFQTEEVLARVKTHTALRQAQQRLQTQNTHLQQEIIKRNRAEKDLQQRNSELSLLNQVGQMFSSSLELDHVLGTALQEVQRLLDVISTSIWLLVPETEELECRQIIGPGSEHLIHVRLPAGEGITGWVARHGESLIIPDIFADSRHHQTAGKPEDSPARSMLSIPLKVKGDVIGVLNLTDPRVDHFSRDDLRFVEPLSAAAASAVENARLYTISQQEIAERKRAEAALREANASKDTFFSIISHDLRSPFSALLGFTQLMFENFDTYDRKKLKRFIGKVHTSAERLYALLENLLTWSRVQRGVMEHEPEKFDLQEIIEDNVALFLSKAEHKQVALTSSIQEGLGAYADYNMVNTVVRNLTQMP